MGVWAYRACFYKWWGILECVSDNVVPARQLVEDKGPTL